MVFHAACKNTQAPSYRKEPRKQESRKGSGHKVKKVP